MSNYLDYGFDGSGASHTNNFILDPILDLISNIESPKILDIGCGNGWLVDILIQKGYDAYGIDASESGINVAKTRHQNRFFLQNLESKKIPEDLSGINFNVIVSTEVIEHLYSPLDFVRYCAGIFKNNGVSNGKLILSTPYHGYIKNLLLSISGKMDSHFTVNWEGGHIKFFSKKTITVLLENEKFKVDKIIGCGRISYLWKSMVVQATCI